MTPLGRNSFFFATSFRFNKAELFFSFSVRVVDFFLLFDAKTDLVHELFLVFFFLSLRRSGHQNGVSRLMRAICFLFLIQILFDRNEFDNAPTSWTCFALRSRINGAHGKGNQLNLAFATTTTKTETSSKKKKRRKKGKKKDRFQMVLMNEPLTGAPIKGCIYQAEGTNQGQGERVGRLRVP